MTSRAIGVFDSGLGGLTAVKHLLRLLRNEDIIYFGDTARVPYGNRSKKTIVRYARQAMALLLSLDVKYLINACGTMSTALPYSCKISLPVPYLDVLDATADAALSASKRGSIGLIATAATVRSGSFETALRRFDPHVVTHSIACPLFVPLVENGYVERDNPVTRLVAEGYLKGFQGTGIDTLILGCTHYPIISDCISDVLLTTVGGDITLIDSGYETAKRLMSQISSDLYRTGSLTIYTSDMTPEFTKTASTFLGREIAEIKTIDIETIPPFGPDDIE